MTRPKIIDDRRRCIGVVMTTPYDGFPGRTKRGCTGGSWPSLKLSVTSKDIRERGCIFLQIFYRFLVKNCTKSTKCRTQIQRQIQPYFRDFAINEV